MDVQTSLFRADGALVIDAGAPFVVFEFRGAPRGKGAMRFRVAYSGGGKPYPRPYIDTDTKNYMDGLRWCAKAAMRGRPPTERPVAVLIHAFMPIPVSWPLRDRMKAKVGSIRPTGKPDWDNIGKMLDALTGIVWLDDAPVVDGRVIKLYDDKPALRVEVREMIEPGEKNGR